METNRAVVVKKFGAYEALSVQQWEIEPLDDKIEVKVEYGAVNFADLYTRQGLMRNKKLPFVLGIECVGTITAIGNVATDFCVGQRVIVYDAENCGLYRDYVRVNPANLYLLPDNVSFEEGAVLFVNYLTAYVCLFELGNLRENQTVLILSCAGGVGWAATQLAKTVANVSVIGTTSSSKHEEVLKNGVDKVLELDDKFNVDVKKNCPEGFDLIISNQSGSLYTFLQTLLKPLGRIILIGANNLIHDENKLSTFSLLRDWFKIKSISLEELIYQNRIVGGFHLGTLIEKDRKKVEKILKTIFNLLEEKKICVKIHAIHSINEIVEATKLLAERRNVGKVLISMKYTKDK